MKIIGIIPARYASTRFPGKPLALISGKTMIQRVYEQAGKVLDYVVVATDNQKIYDKVLEFNGKCVLTGDFHKSGTERCAEALDKATQLFNTQFDLTINIQGDEPFILPEQIKQLANTFNDKKVQVATLAKKIENKELLFSPNAVKVVFSASGKALYFSRSVIPYIRGIDENEWLNKADFYKHLGIYAYRSEILKKLVAFPEHMLEKAESLEQNRWLSQDVNIHVGITDYESYSIDTPDDLENLNKLIQEGKIRL